MLLKQSLLYKKHILKTDSPKLKEAKITKTLLSHILTTKLGIDKETYQKMRIKEVFKTDKDEIIVQFSDPENVGYIYSLTPKLDKNDKISFCEYIPAQFFKRHRDQCHL